MPTINISDEDLDALQDVRNDLPRDTLFDGKRAALTRILNAGGLS